VPTPFALFVKARLIERGWSLRDFAAQLDPQRPVGSLVGYVSKVLNGKVAPPLARLDTWADALHLNPAQRAHFFELAQLVHTPEQIQRLVGVLRNEVASLSQRVASLTERYRTDN
jgi:transcriptional regulator with XRE-family HTH domain